jgi:hypothetical protein
MDRRLGERHAVGDRLLGSCSPAASVTGHPEEDAFKKRRAGCRQH